MVLLLPLSTIIVIGVVSLILVLVIIIAIGRSTCCKGRKDKRKAKDEELDRFLSPDEESEDEILSPVITDKQPKEVSDDVSAAPAEDTFYFGDVTVQGSIEVDETPPRYLIKEDETSVAVGFYEVVVLENPHVEEKLETTVESALAPFVSPVPIFMKETTPTAEEVPLTFESDIKVDPPIDAVVIEVPPTADPVPPAEPVVSPETGSDELLDAIEGALPVEPQVDPAAEPSSIEIEIDAPLATEFLAIPGSSANRTGSFTSDISTGSNQSGLDPSKKKLGRSTNRINSKFSENATLKVNLQYIKSVKCLKGSIVSVESLNFDAEHVPHEINFHLRFFPNKKFHMATKHKPIVEDNHTLNLTFTMGPVYPEDLMNNKLRIKLYGKKAQRLTRSKCYGECALDLYEVVDKDEPVVFEERLIQRIAGAGTYSSDSDGVM